MLKFSPLSGVHRADAAIVGGGWTGLLTADLLARAGMKVALITEHEPASGAESLPVSLCQPQLLRRISAFHGDEAAQAHLQLLRQIVSSLPDWLKPLAAFRKADFYTFARTPPERGLLKAHLRFLSAHGLDAELADDAGGCPFPVELSYRSEGLLIDASSLAQSLCRRILRLGGQIFARSRVLNATAAQVYSALGRVDAGCVLLCTGKPLGLSRRSLLSLLETRTVIRCRLTGPAPLHTVQTAVLPGGLTLLPVSGGAEAFWDAGRTGVREEEFRTGLLLRTLRLLMPEWRASSPEFRLMIRPDDGLPVVGSFRAEHGHILCGSGAEDFPRAMLTARALARLALRKPSDADLLLRPDRPLPRKAAGKLMGQLRRQRAMAALRVTPRCSHCRCRLRYHARPRWWGCPFCGSVFGVLGERLGGPALSDGDIPASRRPGW